MLYSRLRHWLKPFTNTPFHPQWLVFREQPATLRTVLRWANGYVLDVGCGNRWLAGKFESSNNYVGLDYPPTITQGYAGHPDVFGDAAHLPFRKSSIDTILMLDVLEHLQSPESALEEAAKALKPGGHLILQVPFMYPLHDTPHDFRRWTIEGLRQLFSSYNLKIVEEFVYGHPAETAAAMTTIALAKGGLEALLKHRISMLLIPLIVLMIPLLNITGWLLGKALPADPFMPLGYRIVTEKIG